MDSSIFKNQLLEEMEVACRKQGISSTIVKKVCAIQSWWERSQGDASS